LGYFFDGVMHKMDVSSCKRQLNPVVDHASLCINNLLYAYENSIDDGLLLKPSRLKKDKKKDFQVILAYWIDQYKIKLSIF
jgi:hypothetical protein